MVRVARLATTYSHSSEAALPSATEGLTSVFGMETRCFPSSMITRLISSGQQELLMEMLLPRQSAITEK